MVDGLPSLLYSSLVKVSHYRLFCFSRICIFFLFSSQSLLNLLTLFLISYVFSQISNLLSLSLPLSLFYLLLFPFLTSHAPFTPSHVPPQIFHHHAPSLSQSYVSPSRRPPLPTLDSPPSSFLPSNAILSLAIQPRHRRLSPIFSLVSSLSSTPEPIVDLRLVGGRAVCRRHRAARPVSPVAYLGRC